MQGKVYRYIGSETAPLQLWRQVSQSGEAWWFGWSETEMYLPQRLNGTLPNADWERLSLFNADAELRIFSQGTKIITLLLTEGIDLSGDWNLCEQYPKCDEGKHILLGDPPKSAAGPTTRLYDVAFPTAFDYGIELSPHKDKIQKVVLQVRYYYDSAHRLRSVRYAGINKKFDEVRR